MAKQPAKGQKTPTRKRKAADQTPESAAKTAPVVDAIPAEVRTKTVSTTSAPNKPATKEVASSAKPAAEPSEDSAAKAAPRENSKTPTPASAKNQPDVTAEKPKTAPAQQNSFLPLALGGLVAGVIGFAVATFTAPQIDDSLANQVAAQSSTIAGLEQRLADLPETDLSGIETALADLTVRLDEIEARPIGVAAPSGDVSAVSADMEALRAQIAEMTDAAQTELAQARAAAASIEENAASAARNSAARAALSRVQTALESGAPIGAALGDLEEATGDTAPDALSLPKTACQPWPAFKSSSPKLRVRRLRLPVVKAWQAKKPLALVHFCAPNLMYVRRHHAKATTPTRSCRVQRQQFARAACLTHWPKPVLCQKLRVQRCLIG